MQKGEWDMGSIRDLIVEGAGRYDQSDPEGLAATYADDAVLTAPPGVRAEGKRAILDYWVQLSRAFTDKTGEVGRSAETADTYFGEITFRGTNTGDLTMPDGTTIPATGKPVEVHGVEFARVRDGKLVEHNMYWDTLVMMRQLGLLPG
jgi:ketosteroid isomerase-like protein